jgi:hypothetical protein
MSLVRFRRGFVWKRVLKPERDAVIVRPQGKERAGLCRPRSQRGPSFTST